MKIQQRDNETLAACVHHFKMEAKRVTSTVTLPLCIFVKGLWDAHNIAAKVCEKDPQTLSVVIKPVEKLNMAEQVTTTLSPPMVNMMSNDNRYFVCGKAGNIGHYCPSVQCYNCDGLGDFTKDCPEKTSHQKHPITTTDHAPIHIMIGTAGTDHNLSNTDVAG